MTMTLEELGKTLDEMQTGEIARIHHDLFAELFPPGESDERAREDCFKFAHQHGCRIENKPTFRPGRAMVCEGRLETQEAKTGVEANSVAGEFQFTAKLIGQTDGYEVQRGFDDRGRAIMWMEGPGLRSEDFSDQTARGELWENGNLTWTKSGLQAPEYAEREAERAAQRFLAEIDISSLPLKAKKRK